MNAKNIDSNINSILNILKETEGVGIKEFALYSELLHTLKRMFKRTGRDVKMSHIDEIWDEIREIKGGE